MRSKKAITKKIEELISDKTNFVGDNYGSEAADNGIYEVYFSEYNTQQTLENFAKWLLEK